MEYIEVKEKLEDYLVARIPFISLETLEKERAIKLVKEINEEKSTNMFLFSLSKGLYDIRTGTVISDEKNLIGLLSFISEDIKNKRNITYIITDVNELNEDNVVSRYLCDLIALAEEHSCSIVVITEMSIWLNIKRLGMNVVLDYPNKNEIYNLLTKYIVKFKDRVNIEWNDDDIKEASITLQGLSEAEIKNIMSVYLSKGNLLKADIVELKFAKDKMFSAIDGLEKVEVDDVTCGGLKSLKKWLNSKKKLFDVSNKEILEQRGIRLPRGILIVGVPGCGKSLTAKAISKEWNMPLYLLDFATVQGKYVGQSEEQLKMALETSEHVSPCILWIDEIEKGLSGMNDSSGVTSKMVGQFLFWLQECQKEVFVVATANSVEALPPELLRKGRFDEIFYIGLPKEEERKEIIEIYFNKYLQLKLDPMFLDEIVRKTAGFSSSDIEAGIRDLAYQSFSNEIDLTASNILRYFENCSSITKTNPEKIQKIENWCESRAKNAS